MPGPSARLKKLAEEAESALQHAKDKLSVHIRLFLGEDELQDKSKRDKDYLRDKYIIPRMRRLKKRVVMLSDVKGVRFDQFLQLSRKEDVAGRQVKRLRRLANRMGAPDPILETETVSYSITPEFKAWLDENPVGRQKASKIAGATRLCPIREVKKRKGEVRVECEK